VIGTLLFQAALHAPELADAAEKTLAERIAVALVEQSSRKFVAGLSEIGCALAQVMARGTTGDLADRVHQALVAALEAGEVSLVSTREVALLRSIAGALERGGDPSVELVQWKASRSVP
jgi:hypothetical protein